MQEMEIETDGVSGSCQAMEMETEMEASEALAMKEMEMETADPDAAMKEMDIENDGASGSWKAMEMGLETEMQGSEAPATSRTNRNVCNPKRPSRRTWLCTLRLRRPCLSPRMAPSPHAAAPVAWTNRCA